MAVEGKAVSKRSARAFQDEAGDTKTLDQRPFRSPHYEDVAHVLNGSISSSSTTTTSSRSSFSIGEAAELNEFRGAFRTPGTSSVFAEDAVELDLRDVPLIRGADMKLGPGSDVSTEASEGGRSSTSDTIPRSHEHHHEEILNFGTVVPGVYRSSYPRPHHYPFIQGLKLKTIVTLVSKDLSEGYTSFMADNGINHIIIHMKGTKKEDIPIRTMKTILRTVLDQQNHPLLIHCNHGKHRTGCVVAVVRKLSGWELPSIIDEYKAYAGTKVRDCDIKYIRAFDLSQVSNVLVRESNFRYRVKSFLRVSLFAFFVLFIWLLSSTKIVTGQRRLRSIKQ